MPRAVFADLAMGGWSPRHAARELALQLGIALPEAGDGGGATIIGAGVDREARGDGTLITAFSDALAIAAALPAGTLVRMIRPRFGLPLRQDNAALLRYLRRLGVPVRIERPPGAAEDPLPPLLQLYPGTVPGAVVDAVGAARDHPALAPLAGDRFLVDPAARRTDPARHPQHVDLLARFERADARLAAFCQWFGSPLFVDAPALCALAQAALPTSADLALALAERARRSARTVTEAATTELQLQGIRIFLHRFAEVAAVPDPPAQLPQALRDELLTLKGWGKVMTGDPADADRCFGGRMSAVLASHAPQAGDLYFLNIAALARFRGGDLAGALAIETKIEALIAADPAPDPALVFVNAINLARLNRARGDAAEHHRYLTRAFDTTDNVRSLSEALQLNTIEGDIWAEADPPRAAMARLRAALLWLAAAPPEAVGVRAVRAVLGQEPPHARRIDAAIATALESRLRASWDVAPLVLDALPQVITTDGPVAAPPPARQIACEGVALLWSPEQVPGIPRAPATLRLACHAFAVLETRNAGLPRGGCWIIDGAASCDVRASAADARVSAWRHGLGEARPALALGPAVQRIDHHGDAAVVRFKRHLAPLVIEGAAAGLARAVERGEPAGDAAAARELIQQRVLAVHV